MHTISEIDDTAEYDYMVKRIISGAVLVVIFASGLLLGRYVLLLMLLATSLAGMRELFQTTGTANSRLDNKRFDIAAFIGYITTVVYFAVIGYTKTIDCISIVLLIYILILMGVYVFVHEKYTPVDIMVGPFGFIYIPVMLSMIYFVRNMELGIYIVWFVFICSWVCDTCAYFVGSAIGKHKLAPVLSPKKSVEGAVGGVAGSVIVALIYGYVLSMIIPDIVSVRLIWTFVLIALVGSVFSQVGDLFASAIKRHYGVKDYGALIPGHGGILDRFDSVIVVAPVIYMVMIGIMK